MREIPIFIASSILEFEDERRELSVFLDGLNDTYEESGVELKWKRPETMSRTMEAGGTQRRYDKKILESRFFFLIIGAKLGKYTEAEFNLAWEQYQKTGFPLILPVFPLPPGVYPDESVYRFREKIKKDYEQYLTPYPNFEAVKPQILIELIRGGAFAGDAEPSGREETAQKGQEAARDLIREQREKIKKLESRPVSPRVIEDTTAAYEELRRLAQTYHVEPDALLDYMVFLWKQHLYDRGIELGHWLENFYRLEDPGDYKLSLLKNRLGLCYDESNRHKQAERYYREELEIRRRLAEGNPAAYEPYVATTCFNLGLFERQRGDTDAAKRYFEEALALYEKFPHLAKDAQDCRDELANL